MKTYINMPLLEACPWMSTYKNSPECLEDITGVLIAPPLSTDGVVLLKGKSKLASSSLGTSPTVEEPLEVSLKNFGGTSS